MVHVTCCGEYTEHGEHLTIATGLVLDALMKWEAVWGYSLHFDLLMCHIRERAEVTTQ